ncbi:uncharacterized protein LOC135436894 [Drosophila montana]|uniref:uncharacterized protein LOC135436894 n=1 Tax=Drosophila montana TaxID=40370 RepID=UPI00313E148D
MEHLCKLFFLDLCEVMGRPLKSSEMTDIPNTASCFEPVECLSYTIRHKYPKRLVTYDAEELCESRLIRYSDLTESVMDVMKPVCQKQHLKKRDKDKTGKTNDKVRELIKKSCKPLSACEKLTEQQIQQLERCGKELHQITVSRLCAGDDQRTKPTWQSLKPIQKFCFYWQALTGHELRPTPYENFKEIFMRRYVKECPQASVRRLRTVVQRTWRRMKGEQRVPFNLYALLYHVSTGAVDPFDHCAVRVLLNRWR